MELRSYQFRREREAAWRELESLLMRGEKKGLASLTANELFRLPMLYRGALSALSVARSISLDANLLKYLERLSARGYFLIYGVRGSGAATVWRFLLQKFPAEVRKAFIPIVIATIVTLIGVLAGYMLTSGNADWFYTFVPQDLAQGRTPVASTDVLRDTIFSSEEIDSKNMLAILSTFLFTHNAQIGMLAFALGFTFGVLTIALLFYNGTVLGAFISLFASRGLGGDFLGWVLIHGTTELLAVILCGAAGLLLAKSVIFPGEKTHLESISEAGKRAAIIVLGSVLLFLVAGLLEGFARQLIQDTVIRLAIGGTMLGFWLGYFVSFGRREERT